MIAQKMFAEELIIRQRQSELRKAVEQERYRFNLYSPQNPGGIKAKEAWKARIVVYTEVSNMFADYLTDYTLNAHGVLKHLREAENLVKLANSSLLYADQLHNKRAERKAIELAEKRFFELGESLFDKVEPQLMASWSQSFYDELEVYEKIVAERKGGYAR